MRPIQVNHAEAARYEAMKPFAADVSSKNMFSVNVYAHKEAM